MKKLMMAFASLAISTAVFAGDGWICTDCTCVKGSDGGNICVCKTCLKDTSGEP